MNLNTQKFILASKQLSKTQLEVIKGNIEWIVSENDAIVSASGLTQTELDQAIANATLSTSQTTATATTTGLSAAFKGLWATLMANPILLVIGAVVAGATAWSKYKQYIEETRQAPEEAANTYKESASSIDDYVSKYQELRKALIEAKGDEEETYNVKKQLLDLQTELNEKFGDEYGKLNLVIDAYKDQAKAIKAYNKEAAQTYLNENQKGIETAAEKMTDINHYNLSYTGISSVSDEGKALKEIAEKYADQGVKILDELGDGSQFSIHLKADPQSAYDTINAFESDVRDKAKELGDEHLFDDVLDMSSNSLNDAKSIIDEWGEIYQQSLLANIATDDTLSEGYNKAIAAVEAYNEAVLQSKDPYSDEHVAKARQNLQSVYEELSGEEWEKYGSVVQDVFDQADTSVYDFNQTLKNDDDLKTLAEDLEGLSNLDLQSLNPGENASFDKLKASADESGISVENLIDALVRLGYVQGEIASAAPQLDSKWDYSATIKNLDTAKEKLNVLGQTYAKLFDEDSSIGFEDLSSIAEAFGDIEELDITSFIQQLQEAGQNGGQVKSVIGNLISKYLSLSGILGNVTAKNQQLITSFLEEEGVVNANEIVTANLAAQELYLKLNLDDATSSIYDQVTGLMEQEVTTGTAYSALYDLIVEQNIFSTNSTLDVGGKIKALEELALAYGYIRRRQSANRL